MVTVQEGTVGPVLTLKRPSEVIVLHWQAADALADRLKRMVVRYSLAVPAQSTDSIRLAQEGPHVFLLFDGPKHHVEIPAFAIEAIWRALKQKARFAERIATAEAREKEVARIEKAGGYCVERQVVFGLPSIRELRSSR